VESETPDGEVRLVKLVNTFSPTALLGEGNPVERLQALRARRDSSHVEAALGELERRAAASENLLPAILAAVEAYATVGEISNALRRVFGEYQESVVI